MLAITTAVLLVAAAQAQTVAPPLASAGRGVTVTPGPVVTGPVQGVPHGPGGGGGTYHGPGDTVPPGAGSGGGATCAGAGAACSASVSACSGANHLPDWFWQLNGDSEQCTAQGYAEGYDFTIGSAAYVCSLDAAGQLPEKDAAGNVSLCYSPPYPVEQAYVFESSWVGAGCGLSGGVPTQTCVDGAPFAGSTTPLQTCDTLEVCIQVHLDCLCPAVWDYFATEPFLDPDKWLWHIGWLSCNDC